MSGRLAALVLLAILEPLAAHGAELKSCESATAPLMTLDSSWADISKAAADLPFGCNDGYFGEGISDTIVRKMGQDWPGFIKQLGISSSNDKFFAIVLTSINATLDPDDIQIVLKLAKTSCPRKFKSQCAAIGKKSKEALADYNPPETPKTP